MPTVHERLRAARKKLGFTQQTLSDALDVTKAAVSSYETGRVRPSDEVNTLLSSRGVNLHWLLTGEGEMLSAHSDVGHGKPPGALDDTPARRPPDVEELDGDDLIEIPTAPYGHAASFDFPIDNTDGGPASSYFRESTLRAMLGGANIPRDSKGRVTLRLSFAVGDSMAPFIPHGQPFLFEEGGRFVDGARYALWLGSVQADVIKRVEVQGGGVVLLRSDNPSVRTKVLRTGEEEATWLDEEGRLYDLEIRGQVIWPLDTPAAVVGQISQHLTQLAMSALRGGVA